MALVVLETLKTADRPGEVLDDENVTVTIPRRLGLSGVVEAQIRRYRQEARLRGRITGQEARDLLRLVTRRPDCEELFLEIGRSLTAASDAPRWRRLLPRRLAFHMARRRLERRLRALFGGPVVRQVDRPFAFEAVDDLLLDADPGGEACGVVTGLARGILRAAGMDDEVRHVACRGRGDPACRWATGDLAAAATLEEAGADTNDREEGR